MPRNPGGAGPDISGAGASSWRWPQAATSAIARATRRIHAVVAGRTSPGQCAGELADLDGKLNLILRDRGVAAAALGVAELDDVDGWRTADRRDVQLHDVAHRARVRAWRDARRGEQRDESIDGAGVRRAGPLA